MENQKHIESVIDWIINIYDKQKFYPLTFIDYRWNFKPILNEHGFNTILECTTKAYLEKIKC